MSHRRDTCNARTCVSIRDERGGIRLALGACAGRLRMQHEPVRRMNPRSFARVWLIAWLGVAACTPSLRTTDGGAEGGSTSGDAQRDALAPLDGTNGSDASTPDAQSPGSDAVQPVDGGAVQVRLVGRVDRSDPAGPRF